MNVDRKFTMKASISRNETNADGKKEKVKHDANITISWEGCSEEDVYWFANRQFKIRAGTMIAAAGGLFEEGKTYRAKDYLPGARSAPVREMTPEELLAAVMKNPDLLAKLKAAQGE